MPIFDKSTTKDLRAFLYNSYIHDSELESVRYEHGKDSIMIEANNPIFHVKTRLTFCDIGIALAIRGDDLGSRETILSLTVEDDLSLLQNHIQKSKFRGEDALYLLMQMFSGDELHIIAKKVIIESAKWS